MFLRDTLHLPDVTLDSAWLGFDSTLFLRFRSAVGRLRALRVRRKMFSLPSMIFLYEGLTRSRVVELKCFVELVMAE
jgi:hypothetical protein